MIYTGLVSIKIKPEFEGYVLPELLDSLLVDSIPNKVIIESEIFTLISSVVSQLNSQITSERDVRLYTTYRGNQFDDPSINIKDLGNLGFTYSSISKKINNIVIKPRNKSNKSNSQYNSWNCIT